MRRKLSVIALITIVCIESYSQIIFENGYFIDESNKKIECLIKNMDWLDNPTDFKYKLSQNDSVQEATIETVKEFGINNVSKFIRTKTNIDRSSDEINNLNTDRNPNFQEEILFLKVLIEGEASLFIYSDGSLTRLFFKLRDSEIDQLVYKRYLRGCTIIENNYFKQQLYQQLKCEKIELTDLEPITYYKRDLEKIFITYNECRGLKPINYEPKQKKDLFNLTIRPGLNYSSLEIQKLIIGDSKHTDFGSNIGIRIGIETEFILPFNKNKWGIIIEPTYQYYKSEQTEIINSITGVYVISKVDYKSIEVPVGLRHYFYLNDKSKLFTNISYVFDFPNNSSIVFLRNGSLKLLELNIKSRTNLAFGIGYKFKDRYSLEMRYNTDRNIISEYIAWNSQYNSFNVIFGFSIF